MKKSLVLSPTRAKAELARRSFYRFFCEFWETIETVPLVPNWHIKYICDQLQEVYEVWERGENQPDVLINVPPGSSKSTICTQLFPAWLWTRNAAIRIISSSYSEALSTDHAVKTRDVLTSDKYNLYYPDHIKFKDDTNGKTHYKNTKKGERFVTSTGGTVTGKHADFIINDDPVKPVGAAGAISADLVKGGDFVTKVLPSRKTNKARTVSIMIMQRLHDKDPAGLWLKRKNKRLRHICLPATATKKVHPAHLAEFYVNGLLDVNRLTQAAIDEAKQDLGEFGYSGQFGQDPVPGEGGIWKEIWFKSLPDHLFPEPSAMQSYGTDWDTAYTEKQINDATAWVTSGKIGPNTYVDKLGFARKEMPELIKLMKLLPAPHYIEAKASGKSAAQTLRSSGISAIEVEPIGDKVAKTRMATPPVEAGLVYIRESILDQLLNDEEQGILRFPMGEHDDLNDAFSQAIKRHSGSGYGTD